MRAQVICAAWISAPHEVPCNYNLKMSLRISFMRSLDSRACRRTRPDVPFVCTRLRLHHLSSLQSALVAFLHPWLYLYIGLSPTGRVYNYNQNKDGVFFFCVCVCVCVFVVLGFLHAPTLPHPWLKIMMHFVQRRSVTFRLTLT